MAKAVFTAKVSSSYDDLPEVRYHFPRTYLRKAESAVDDWIVYYEPRRTSSDLSSGGGRQSYFAAARVTGIRPDPNLTGHYYADVADYLDFDVPVPFREGQFYFESGLQKDDGSTNKGLFGRAVRNLGEDEFNLILQVGFGAGAHQSATLPVPQVRERQMLQQVSRRPFRDRAFSASVRRIYDDTCALSGLRILNGGGQPEVQAAHIRPVAADGPDSLRNGLALSSTFHWMFDRGLVSVDDDYTILKKENAIPAGVLALLDRDRRLRLPDQPIHRPHPRFLEYHREHVFKG